MPAPSTAKVLFIGGMPRGRRARQWHHHLTLHPLRGANPEEERRARTAALRATRHFFFCSSSTSLIAARIVKPGVQHSSGSTSVLLWAPKRKDKSKPPISEPLLYLLSRMRSISFRQSARCR